MTLNELLQEAFDKRVGGTAMIPASDLLSAMTALEQLNETIAQQAEAIRLKDAALDFIDSENASEEVIRRASTALAIQPSPDILQARDERVAGACVSVIEEVIASFGKRSLVGVTKTKICLQMVI